MLKKGTFYLTVFLSVLFILMTLLSLIHDVPYWYIKILDFPRLQVFIASLICFLVLLWLQDKWTNRLRFLIAGLVISAGIQAYFIFPCTTLAEKTVESAKKENKDQNSVFSLMIANVWMENESAADFLEIVLKENPDIVLVMETNQGWISQLGALGNSYSYKMEHPLDNTYGMALYSKFPLEDSEIRFLNHETVPSFHTRITLPNKMIFNFHGVHPVPPRPGKYPDNIGEEEIELLKVGKMVARENEPSLVAGDFNDVAWSYTSSLFGEEGNLKDVRVGRGLYNSFNAKSWVWSWPLDHVYVTEEFKVSTIKRLSDFGSDHYPILVELRL